MLLSSILAATSAYGVNMSNAYNSSHVPFATTSSALAPETTVRHSGMPSVQHVRPLQQPQQMQQQQQQMQHQSSGQMQTVFSLKKNFSFSPLFRIFY